MLSSEQQAWLKELGKFVGVAIGAKPASGGLEIGNVVGGATKATPAGEEHARARSTQGSHEKTEGQGDFISTKGVLVFDFAPSTAMLTPNQERVLLSQQVKFSSRGAPPAHYRPFVERRRRQHLAEKGRCSRKLFAC